CESLGAAPRPLGGVDDRELATRDLDPAIVARPRRDQKDRAADREELGEPRSREPANRFHHAGHQQQIACPSSAPQFTPCRGGRARAARPARSCWRIREPAARRAAAAVEPRRTGARARAQICPGTGGTSRYRPTYSANLVSRRTCGYSHRSTTLGGF